MPNSQFQKGNILVDYPKKYYCIQFRISDKYPFNGIKPNTFQVSARTRLVETHSKIFSVNVNKLTQVSSDILIQLQEIIETHASNNYYTLKYEYIPHSLLNIQQHINFLKHETQIRNLCRQLATYGILVEPRIQDFGLTADFQLKYFLRPDFSIIQLDAQGKKDRYIEEIAQKFEYSFIRGATLTKQLKGSLGNKNTDKGIESIAEKIKKLRQNLFKVEMLNQEIKAVKQIHYASEKNLSENSQNNTQTVAKEEAGFQDSRIFSEKEHFFEDSYSCRGDKIKKKRTSSFQLDQKKPKSENKQKKASWGQKCSRVESDKATVLKKRVTDALLKTKKTLNKYEKIRTKSSRKIM